MFERAPIPRKDASGKIISEGDVIELIVPNEGYESEEEKWTLERVQVAFSNENCAFMFRCFFARSKHFDFEEILGQKTLDEYKAKIVGNIHEEPWLEHTLGWKNISEKEIPK